jgi:hypothetical protein
MRVFWCESFQNIHILPVAIVIAEMLSLSSHYVNKAFLSFIIRRSKIKIAICG